MFRWSFAGIAIILFLTASAQNAANDTEAAELLKKISEKYQGYKNVSADFTVIIQRPKLKPQDDDKKYIDSIRGFVILQGEKFYIKVRGQEIYCDGKNLWTYNALDRETQLNLFEESDDMLSPSKVFGLYKEGFIYQIKEKKRVGGKSITVIEMSPSAAKKLSYFKVDVGIDEATQQIVETKVYERNGSRYTYKLTKQTPNVTTGESTFTYDPKKHPGVKVVDLR